MDADRRRRLARELGDDELAGLLVSARREVVEPVPTPVAERHLGAVLAVAGATATTLAASGAGAAAAGGGGFLLGTKLAAAVGAAAVVTGGGMAATGTLPDPAQTFVADVAEAVSLELPRPEGAPAGVPGTDDTPPGPGRDQAPEREHPDGVPGLPEQPQPAPGRGGPGTPDELPADDERVPDGTGSDEVPADEARPAAPDDGGTPAEEPGAGDRSPDVAPPAEPQEPPEPAPSPPAPAGGRSAGG